MKIFGLAGWSGSGKTTLMIRLIPELTVRGISVSTMKHAHHTFDLDTPGKDSFEHRKAGATEVLITSGRRWALMHELRKGPEPNMEELIARMSPVDLLLVEGYKGEGHDKLEVYNSSLGKPMLWHEDSNIVAIASDQTQPDISVPQMNRDDIAAIADFIVARCNLNTLQHEAS